MFGLGDICTVTICACRGMKNMYTVTVDGPEDNATQVTLGIEQIPGLFVFSSEKMSYNISGNVPLHLFYLVDAPLLCTDVDVSVTIGEMEEVVYYFITFYI